MKFGVREICDVVLKAKANQRVGNKLFYAGEPVIYFDTLKTSSMEGAATTVYAQGGRGNSRLVAWEGERTVTFTMEDALISPAGFMILSGAGLIDASSTSKIKVHTTERITLDDTITNGSAGQLKDDTTNNAYKITLSKKPYYSPRSGDENKPSVAEDIYVMIIDDNGEDIKTEPILVSKVESGTKKDTGVIVISKSDIARIPEDDVEEGFEKEPGYKNHHNVLKKGMTLLVDYYVERTSGVKQIEITPNQFGGNYYLEASTLFRNQNGTDMPAEFIIPNCKIQSNFTFTMASSGDPSSFTFTMDAFPDYTRFDRSKKVLAAIQIIEEENENEPNARTHTDHDQNTSESDSGTNTTPTPTTPTEYTLTVDPEGGATVTITRNGETVTGAVQEGDVLTITLAEGYSINMSTSENITEGTGANNGKYIVGSGDVVIKLTTG